VRPDSDDGAVLGGQDFRTVQRVCQALREDIKTMLKANAAGWAGRQCDDRTRSASSSQAGKFFQSSAAVTPATTNIRSRRHYPNSET